ncbi:uncharacterized protein VTP21DRAFT_7524 [Calcarisporiella thermophila]|uniref:uncharacterized protein n=1 Tax=Calcarisporiella thermophila TaxID=911321 RepID=UPI0037426A28
MARFASWLVLLFVCTSLCFGQQSVSLRTHTLQAPYIDQGLQNRWWDYGGSAIINTNKHIRLTSDQPSLQGYLWSRLPLSAPNWEVEFEFKVDGKGGHLYGDGFAVFLTKQRAQIGPVFGFMDKFEGLGIFFDTYKNSHKSGRNFPYVMAMQGDGTTSYDFGEDGFSNQIAGCEADFRAKSFPTKARITYYRDSFLELQLQYTDFNEWTHCFTLNNVTLPPVFYLGFSAHTGDVSDNHDIISVETKSLITVPNTKPGVPQTSSFISKKTIWSVFMFYIKLAMFCGVVCICVLGYRMMQRSNNKRF